jgi:hypothetical protein
MLLESVLVVAVPETTVRNRSSLTGRQEEGLVLDDDWLLMSDSWFSCCSWMLVMVVAVLTTKVGDRSRLTCGHEEGSVLGEDWLLMSGR